MLTLSERGNIMDHLKTETVVCEPKRTCGTLLKGLFYERRTKNVAELQTDPEVAAALAAWKDAARYFENVSDPELVRFAAYKLEAAKIKYLFLLKHAHKIE